MKLSNTLLTLSLLTLFTGTYLAQTKKSGLIILLTFFICITLVKMALNVINRADKRNKK